MKNAIRRTVAGISSLAMMAALSATTVPAFAAEYEAAEAQKFVESYVDEQEKMVAQYCVDNCDSLEEAVEFMDLYKEGVSLRTSEDMENKFLRSSSSGEIHINDVYYNGKRIASTPHRAALLVMNTTAAMKGSVQVTWNHSVISYDTQATPYTIINTYTGLKAFSDIDDVTNEEYFGVYGRIKKTTETPGNAGVLCYFPIETLSRATSESAVHSAFTVDTKGIYSTNGTDSDVELHTYALGDYDHNGIVNSADASYLLDLLTYHEVNFSYNSESTGISGPISALAADANEDGQIDLSDVSWINHHKS